jgi:hypothetical protein
MAIPDLVVSSLLVNHPVRTRMSDEVGIAGEPPGYPINPRCPKRVLNVEIVIR